MREEVRREVEQFLYREARLLDERRLHEWVELFTEDARYWMSGRASRYPVASKAIGILDHDRYSEEELAKEDELAIFDETKATLQARVARLDTGMAWAEDPPSRTRHLVTNVVVHHIDPDQQPGFSSNDLHVRSSFLVYRNRLEREENIFAGRRIDVLRRTQERLQVARRVILLDQNVLQAKNISTFF
jgi:3-phenylpropionate/cinnamic acid dioxygenase small subunit